MTNPSNHTSSQAAHTEVGTPVRPRRRLRIVGWVAAAAMALLMIKWVLMTAVLLAAPFGLWWVIDRAGRGRRLRVEQAARVERAARRRAEVESRAVVDAAGGCGWCGSRIAHRGLDGRLVMPLEHHRADIDHTLTAAPSTSTSTSAVAA